MINDPQRHSKLLSKLWSEEEAYQEVVSIYEDTLNRLRVHDQVEGCSYTIDNVSPKYNSLYLGTSGIIWGLMQIEKFLQQDSKLDIVSLIESIHREYLNKPDTGSVIPSFLAGESGILLLNYRLTNSSKIKDKLTNLILSNFDNPTNEMLFGSPGTILLALHLNDESLFKSGTLKLLNIWHEIDQDTWMWEQEFDGEKYHYLGAAHGLLGNIQPLLRGKDYLTKTQYKDLLEKTERTVIKSSIRTDGLANWPTVINSGEKSLRLQWCHGAPGIVTSLRHFPRKRSEKIEELLLEAGELIWRSGPLQKGVGLCHGTDGNGYAFLTLYERTGDVQWLERARLFAMHSILQRKKYLSLWTGDIGLALYIISCLEAKSDFPCLDYF